MNDTYRNRHDREEHHFGDTYTTLVALSSAIDVSLPADMTAEDALSIINDRILVLEDEGRVIGRFTIDAVVS
jgi:hypothetical protein